MKMNKITQFFKRYVFYIAMGIVVVGAAVAVLFLPSEGNIKPDTNVQNKQADSKVTDEYENEVITVDDTISSEVPEETEENPSVEEGQVSNEVSENTSGQQTADVAQNSNEDEVSTETFESTTVDSLESPFFAEGDTFGSPVKGKIIVPYTDDSTKYWFSKSLNQTMRTYGVCLSADQGEEVKAVAQGTVLDVLTDSTTLADASMPYVGNVMVIDLGNGYKVTYGFQNGTPDVSLKGQVVNAGDVLGKVGSPTGAFISEGDNIYLQVTHDNKVISPENFFKVAEIE